ncbi:hypothetical protein Hamer_G028630 [Homarus americanus]|uniref:Uncharacterized protein n=1 Tax=Homarus americanus TaxID=6706 RepID=A0A8J5JRA5_HOMAM|nr:hypothetical protein Hamer_G028630 [Homarus americanus]
MAELHQSGSFRKHSRVMICVSQALTGLPAPIALLHVEQ